MITVEEARARVLAKVRRTGMEVVGLAEGFERVLAVDVVSRVTQPPADVSAMDGYALRAADGIAGASLKVIGAAPAGHPFAGEVGPGEAVRLFTGSFVPAGADTVLLQEDAAAADGRVTVREAVMPGRHIRRAGQDFAAGEVLIAAGRQLSARDVALAAAGNTPWVSVFRRPRVAILATGDEISLPGESIGRGGIVSSNSHALAAFVTACGGEPMVLPIAADTLEAVAAGADAGRGADMLVTTGGASVGEHDLVQAGLATRGLKLDFWKIAMRPGKPLIFGEVGGMPLLGLPGNPVSAFVCALLFLKPAIEAMCGLPGEVPRTKLMPLGAGMKANDQREDYVRATISHDGLVIPFPVQDSGMLRTLARADALIRRPAHQSAKAAGEMVEVIRLGDL